MVILKKLIIIVGIVVTLILFLSLYVHQNYLFNPMTFKKDNVVVHDWSVYRLPLVMEVSNISDGWKTTSITDKEDIRLIYEELRIAEKTISNINDSHSNTHFVLTVRRKGTKGSNGFIDQFNGYLDGIVHINNGEKIRITGGVNKYIREVIQMQGGDDSSSGNHQQG